jgi:hypothetical protein
VSKLAGPAVSNSAGLTLMGGSAAMMASSIAAKDPAGVTTWGGSLVTGLGVLKVGKVQQQGAELKKAHEQMQNTHQQMQADVTKNAPQNPSSKSM